MLKEESSAFVIILQEGFVKGRVAEIISGIQEDSSVNKKLRDLKIPASACFC